MAPSIGSNLTSFVYAGGTDVSCPLTVIGAAVKAPTLGLSILNVWATHKGKHQKVLNMAWTDDAVDVVTFRRGEWEGELLAMDRAPAMAVH